MPRPVQRRAATTDARAVRREQILQTAIDVFLERGFENASMIAIATRARASKETVYALFGSKENLFQLIIEAMAGRILAGVEIGDYARPRVVLRAFGEKLLAHMLRPETVMLYRVLIAEVGRAPVLARIFEENGPRPTQRKIAAYLAEATRRGHLACPDPVEGATVLANLISGNHLLRLLIGTDPPMTESELKAWVETAVDIFMARYGPTRERAGTAGRPAT